MNIRSMIVASVAITVQLLPLSIAIHSPHVVTGIVAAVCIAVLAAVFIDLLLLGADIETLEQQFAELERLRTWSDGLTE